jgi:predicted CoA-substrate-specific enzyme activase
MITAGIDIGSISAESVIFQEQKGVLGYSIVLTGGNSREASEISLENALRCSNLAGKDIDYVISTGCGREIVSQSKERVTEITCLARGVNYLFPDCRTIIDIGGQDTKVIQIDGAGRVLAFEMNDKCAAGTGRFLEVMARALNVELDKMGERSLQFQSELQISSICTVFAESEVISLVSEGKRVEDILNALHHSIADRTVSLLERIGGLPAPGGTEGGTVAMTGGVAKNIGVVKAIEARLGLSLRIYQEPQIVSALGAALIAAEKGKSRRPIEVSV